MFYSQVACHIGLCSPLPFVPYALLPPALATACCTQLDFFVRPTLIHPKWLVTFCAARACEERPSRQNMACRPHGKEGAKAANHADQHP